MSKFWGLLFFWEKNRRRPPGLGTQGVTVRPPRHLGLIEEWPDWLGLAWLGLAWLGLAWLVFGLAAGSRDLPKTWFWV